MVAVFISMRVVVIVAIIGEPPFIVVIRVKVIVDGFLALDRDRRFSVRVDGFLALDRERRFSVTVDGFLALNRDRRMVL